MKRKYIWWGFAAIVVIAGVYFGFGRSKQKAGAELIVKVAQGDFEVLVAVTGELYAKNYREVTGPDMRSGVFRLNEVRIQNLVDEGTIVNEGDVVAELDRTNACNAILDMEEQIDQSINRVETAVLDSSVRLKGARDNLLNLRIAIEEAEIQVEQGIFEPLATQRQYANNLDKAKRALEQAQAQYELTEQQQKLTIRDNEIRLDRQQRQYEQMQAIFAGFTIRAPQSGMVIYRRERNGQKRKEGSSINAFDNVVATLPDLSVMLSRTYVNEIDISKVKRGQQVRIGIDAFPDKQYTGEVVSVADIGEQLANTDAKVFEVVIEINESDLTMRPSMTSSNTIIINTMKDVTYVALDAIYAQDSIPYVYTTHNTKQIVVLGESNENEVIVEQGLSPGDRVHVAVPENSATWKMVGEELIPVIKQRELERKKEKEEQERQAAEQSRNPRRRNVNVVDPNAAGGGGGQFFQQRPDGGGLPPGGGPGGFPGGQGGGNPRGGGGGR
jgi:multidrug efflux pump subunit AcrA (membrane-fusion protein)